MTAHGAAGVVRLVARCGLAETTTARPSAWRVQFTVEEFADLSDGRRIPLRYGGAGGFGIQLNEAARASQLTVWTSLTTETLEADVRTAVLPDTDDGEEHPWEALLRALSAAGDISVTTDELRNVPYVVEFSDAVLAELADVNS